MPRSYVFISLTLFLSFAQPKSLAENAATTGNEQEIAIGSYLKNLEELGYCVIPAVLSQEETQILYERVWHEFIEKAWPNCRMDDRSNWKETFPIHNKRGIFAGPAGQIQVMWDLRQDPRIIEPFARIWNTQDLIVSMDGLSFMCPTQIREGYIDPWPHVDQAVLRRADNAAHNNTPPVDFVSESSLKTQPFTIQGQFLFEDSFEGDGGFYCIPKSHLRFTEFAPELEAISAMDIPREERKAMGKRFLNDYFETHKDTTGSSYERKHIIAPRGLLILWDSRTIHWNQHPSINNTRVRMVGYVCYVPTARLTEEGKALRKKAFEEGVSTGHNPAWPELKYTKDFLTQEFEEYREDSSYTQPSIVLTARGESLLGIE